MGCVASQTEKEENIKKKGNTKANNIKRLANKFKIKRPDDKEHLVTDDSEDFKVSTQDLKTGSEEKTKKKLVTKSQNDGGESLPMLGLETFVEVVNGDVRKKFVFKNTVKVVNGKKYMCKFGYNEQNDLVFVRCVLIGNKSSETGNNSTGQRSNGDDIAAFLELG